MCRSSESRVCSMTSYEVRLVEHGRVFKMNPKDGLEPSTQLGFSLA